MEEEGKVTCNFIFKKRNVRSQSSRKRKGSEESRTYMVNFSICDILYDYVAISEEWMLHFIHMTFCKFVAAYVHGIDLSPFYKKIYFIHEIHI
jgi:hypothetical protein